MIGKPTVIDFRGSISKGSSDSTRSVLAIVEGPIVFRIRSPGGLCDEGISMYYQLTAYNRTKGPVKTIAHGECASAATLPLMAGELRAAEEGCEILIHHPRSSVEPLEAAARDWMMEIYAERTRYPTSVLEQLMSKQDFIYDAYDAVAYNLCEFVIPAWRIVPDSEVDYVIGK